MLDGTKETAVAMMDLLGDAFKVGLRARPKLRWSDRASAGVYYPSWKGYPTVVLGPRVWRGLEFTMVHEYAHFIAYTLYDCKGHGPGFIRALREVAIAWYGNEIDYDWKREYKRVAAAGPRKPETER